MLWEGLEVRVLEAGFCTHPGFMVEPGSGFAPRQFPALVVLGKDPERGLFLYDTGYAQTFLDATESFPASLYRRLTPCELKPRDPVSSQLERLDMASEQVQHLILSHFHADHIAGARDFPNALIHCHPAGYHKSRDDSPWRGILSGYIPALAPTQRTCFHEDFPEDVGSLLGVDPIGLGATPWHQSEQIYLVNLPGHALGHLGLLILAHPCPLFFLGDACWHKGNLLDVDVHPLATLLFASRRAYRDTLKKLRTLYRLLHPRVQFIPSHCSDLVRSLVGDGWLKMRRPDNFSLL
jgi:glyoxylase-like metal-dependent hydrolase (beta-lactamase superfamily II)